MREAFKFKVDCNNPQSPKLQQNILDEMAAIPAIQPHSAFSRLPTRAQKYQEMNAVTFNICYFQFSTVFSFLWLVYLYPGNLFSGTLLFDPSHIILNPELPQQTNCSATCRSSTFDATLCHLWLPLLLCGGSNCFFNAALKLYHLSAWHLWINFLSVCNILLSFLAARCL